MRKKGDGKRVMLRRSFGVHPDLTDLQWRELETIIGSGLSIETRQKIDAASRVFSSCGPLHSDENTMLVSEISTQIKAWIKRTDKLRCELKVPRPGSERQPTKAKIISAYWGEKTAKRLGKMLPLQFLAFAVQSALDAGNLVLKDLEKKGINGPLKNDMWSAWVCLIGKSFANQNLSVSTSSNNKTQGSPFVKAVEKLQTYLPVECQRRAGYESIRQGIQEAKPLNSRSEKLLWTILAGFGTNTLTEYPGDLRMKASIEIANFEDTARKKLDDLEETARLRKKRTKD